jgi:aminomethyltransferase
MVDFGGWMMPVQYSGVIEEHNAVRGAAGIFDVSHMGEFEVEGPQAEESINKLVANDVGRIQDGQCQYTAMCYENGTIVDDLIIYRHDPKKYTLVVNAGNIAKDWEWVNRNKLDGVELRNASDATAEVALQGPKAEAILQKVTDAGLKAVRKFRFTRAKVAGVDAMVSRTGYTGEDGFEVYVAAAQAAKVWDALLAAGKGVLLPAGLGARDTLRLEAAMMLYGNDIDDTTTPLEAGLGWTVKLDKRGFIGRSALAKQENEGLKRRLVGFRMTDAGIARHGYEARIAGSKVGHVTSGTFSPTLKAAIGLAYLPLEHASPGCEFDVQIRGKPCKAKVVETPFIRKK